MRSLRVILCAGVFVALAASVATAQRPRPVSNEPATKTETTKTTTTSTTATATTTTPVAPAPQSVRAKYEGGFLGYSKKAEGTLSFDELNQRLVFRDKTNKELVSIPYNAVVSAYPDTQSRTSTAASVVSAVVPFGFPARFIKTKYRYLALQYSDPDTQTSGTTSFKLDTKELIASMLAAIGNKAGLTPRGDAYIRRKATTTATDDASAKPE
jgi:hypothetical protein